MEPKSEEVEVEPQLVSHPRAKSKVWKYFGFDMEEDEVGKRAHCRLCLAQIGYSGNTTNLYAHLQRHHADAFLEFEKSTGDSPNQTQQQQQTMTTQQHQHQHQQRTLQACTRQNSQEARRQAEVTAAVLGFLCEGLHPLATADEPFFQALLRTLEPRYSPPTFAELVAHALPQRQQQVRAAVAAELAGLSCCGVSADQWRSETHGRSYVTLYAHQLAMSSSASSSAATGLRALSRCLKTFEVPADSPAEGITRALYEVFMEWGVTGRVCGATIACGSPDVRKACAQLELPVIMPCFADQLTRGVNDAFLLPGVQALLSRCRRLVDYFQQSVVASYMLQERTKQQQSRSSTATPAEGGGVAGVASLVTERPGCWSSTLAMLQRLRENQPAVTSVLLDDANNQTLLLGAAEWTLLDGLLRMLQGLRSAADMFCRGGSGGGGVVGGGARPTISMLKPVLHMLQSTALRRCEGDPAELHDARRAVAGALDEAYARPAELDMFLKVASFLDPRYKRLPFLTPSERAQVEARVLEEAAALYQRHTPSSPPSNDEPPNKKQAPPDSGTTANPLAVIFCQSGAADSQEEFQAQAEEELSNFKAQKVLGLNEDPLRWWSDRTLLFPMLPRVLQKYWCVPATSAPAHRLFGPAGSALWGKRNRLDPEHVDQQVFLYENTRTHYEPELSCVDKEMTGLV
ncbi:E3 SUMO-protein ligase ZBED1-like [Alosa sapidissima]|uniref:E3 SUMO-protein ligase ZBED1-like n=1 Tax=Alosa sapidissima TaxID=34773 RepID=UPI001C09FF0C|nr:E3 SUMO-protein ligase ZBED1-like [Alosa sapidissima]XP_041935684.1 E3 SUMO-protein ligase ZBED1-like [Alosa sapidissima]